MDEVVEERGVEEGTGDFFEGDGVAVDEEGEDGGVSVWWEEERVEGFEGGEGVRWWETGRLRMGGLEGNRGMIV